MTRRILFVDDEAGILDGLRDLLRRERREWDMVFALGPEAALAEIEGGGDLDAVVADMRMPSMDGAAFLGEVRARRPGAARIVLSGQSDHVAALRAAQVAHMFLAKPCDPARLRAALDRAWALREMLGDEDLRRAAGARGTLPSAPAAYAELTAAAARDDVGVREISEILERDPAMCAKVLQLVNSSFFGLGRPVVHVGRAVAYLGVDTIRSLVLSTEAFGVLGAGLDACVVDTVRRHSLLAAHIAVGLVDECDRDGALTAGLLHDIGKLVLLAEEPGYLAEALERSGREGRPLADVERETRGSTHAEVGAHLLSLWGLPFCVVEAVACHHAPPAPGDVLDLVSGVQVANLLACEVAPGGPGSPADDAAAVLEGAVDEGRLGAWRALALTAAAGDA